jgi:hypothetical protein
MTASKLYRVESFVQGLAIKAPCRVATDAPVVLSGIQTVNGHVGQEGDRILVKDQVDPVENGVYTMEISAWRRDGDFDGSRDVVGGTLVPVWDNGTSSIVQWQVDGEPAKVTPDIDAINFSEFYNPGSSVEVDTLQTVCSRGNTTTTDIEIQSGRFLILKNSDNSVEADMRLNDFEQAFPFLEVYGDVDVEVVRFNFPGWFTGSGVFIGGGGTRSLAFYGYGDAVSGSIAQDGSNNIRITSLGDFELQASGDFDMRDSAFRDFTVKHQSVASAANALAISYAAGQSFNLTLTENITSFSLTNLPIATGDLLQMEGEIIQDGTTAYTITWPGSFEFAGGTAPDLSTLGSKHLVHMRSRDDGTTWLLTHVAEFS